MRNFRVYATVVTVLYLAVFQVIAQPYSHSFQSIHGAFVRGDIASKSIALVFTGDEYADGGLHIAQVLEEQEIKASFFFTGKFYRHKNFEPVILGLLQGGHYLGAHSDQHLLYCSWENRDSLLISRIQFRTDLLDNYRAMNIFGIEKEDAPYFLPPYEWYNDSIAAWSAEMGLQLVNFTYGTLSHADYTVPDTKAYRSTIEILSSILEYESTAPHGLNGFILLSHIGTVSERRDKFYLRLEDLILELQKRGYQFKRIDELLLQETQI